MKANIYQNALLSLAFCLFFSFNGLTLFAQDCGNPRSSAEVTLDSIGYVTISGADNSGEAEDAYEQALADAAASSGAASCNGSCTVGNCEMQFDGYESGSSTPSSTTNNNGDYVFNPPSNGDQTFNVHCPCVVEAQAGHHYPGHLDGGEDNRLLRTSIGTADFNFFPNPADEKINIDIDLQEASSYMILSIINLQGHVLAAKEVGNLGKGQHRFDLDVQSLPPGIYLGLVHLDNEVVSQSRIVIQH